MDAAQAAQLVDTADLDLLDGELYAGDPEPVCAYLREHRPVSWDPTNELWGISRHRDIVAIEKDPATWSNAGAYRPNIPADPSMIGVDDQLAETVRWYLANTAWRQAVTSAEHARFQAAYYAAGR